MPLYSIVGPDGKTYKIEGPEGATREEVIAEITKQKAVMDTIPDNPIPDPNKAMMQDEDAFVKMQEIDNLKQEDITYDALKQNDLVKQAATRFANKHLKYENIDPEDSIDEVIEHFRKFDVNEMVAASDYGYVSGLVADKKEQDINDYKLLYGAYEALPNFYQEGSAPNALGDYLEGLLKAPSTYIGVFLPATGKVAGQAAVQTSKLALNKLLGAAVRNPIKTAIVAEGIGGAAQDVAAQKTLTEVDIQDEYSVGQTAVAAAISAAPVALVPFFVKKGMVSYIERNTGNIVEQSLDSIKKRTDEANKSVDKVLSESDSTRSVFVDTANVLAGTNPKYAALNAELVQKGKNTLKGITGNINAYKDAGIEEPLELGLNVDKYKNILGGLTEILSEGGGLLTKERITEGLARSLKEMQKGKTLDVFEENFGKLLSKYDITTDDIANVFMSEVSDAARLLQASGQAKKDLTALQGFTNNLNELANFDLFGFDVETRKAIEKANKAAQKSDVREYLDKGSFGDLSGKIRAVDQARLAFMTSQVGTTVRNTVSGYARVTFDILTRSLERGIQKVTGKAPLKANDDIRAIYFGLANRKEAEAVRDIFQMGFAKEASKLFRELMDVTDATNGKVSRLHGVSRQLNALNTISDNMFKSAALTGNLKRQLNVLYTKSVNESDAYAKKFGRPPEAKDFNLIEIMKDGRFNDVFGTKDGKKALKQAVDESLYFTYQRSPQNSLSRAFTQMVHSVPFVGTQFVPFPRFMMNAMRYTYEYSPLNMGMYSDILEAGIDATKRVTGGSPNDEVVKSYEQAAKGLVGMAALSGATAFRMSEFAGDNWYEGRTDSGAKYDLRPMFPAAPFLFFGDLIARKLKNEPIFENKKIFQDAIQALTGAQFRAGMGLRVLESAVEEFSSGEPARAEKMAAEFAANTLSTFTIPATVFQDTYNTFLAPDDERILRDNNSDSMLTLIINKSLARIPANYALEKYIEKTLGDKIGYKAPKEFQSATTEETIRRITPLSRQTQGILYRQKANKFEAELTRLKIIPSTVYKRTRNPDVDALYSVLISQAVTDNLLPYIESDEYKNIKSYDKEGLSKKDLQRKMLKKKITEFTADAKKTAINISTTTEGQPIQRNKFEKFDGTIQTLAFEKYHQSMYKPKDLDGYNYEILLNLAREAESKFSRTQF
tara:strand:- start:56 stop:3583 length:3528 start_codon:yes stop_codon:yes gene_type:complete